jgi:hypothetical protein
MKADEARKAATAARERWIAAPRGARAAREAELRHAVAAQLAAELAEARSTTADEPQRNLPYWKQGDLA